MYIVIGNNYIVATGCKNMNQKDIILFLKAYSSTMLPYSGKFSTVLVFVD